MSLKNNNGVAAERRMDLASLFCMIGRHGPAVALAVIVMVSVLAGFIIYRTVRGKRRKEDTAAADGESPGAERDASVIQESTDVSNEGSSDVLKEDADLIQSGLRIRPCRVAAAAAAAAAATAEDKPPLCSLPKSDIQVPQNKHTTSNDTEDVAAISYKVTETYAEEANESLQSDTHTVAEIKVEDAVDWRQRATDYSTKVEEEIHDIHSCMKGPETIHYESCQEEEEKVFNPEYKEDEDVTTDKDVSDKKTSQEEENFQCASSSRVCCEQTLHTSENDDSDKLQDNKTLLETNTVESILEEPVMHIEDVPVTCLCYEKDEEFEDEHHLDSIDYSKYTGNNHLSTEEEKKHEVEDSGLAKVIEEDIGEDHTNSPTAAEFDAHLLQFNTELQIEQKEENDLTCNQEVGVLPAGTDQVKENVLTSDDIAACVEDRDSSSVALSPVLPCLREPVKLDDLDVGLSGVTSNAKAQMSSIADCPELSSDCQQVQQEDQIVATLDEDTNSANVGPQLPSHDAENQTKSNENGKTAVLYEEWNDHVYESHVSSCCKDQQGIQMINNDTLGGANVAACPDTNVTGSRTAEEMSCPHLPSICQDHQSDRIVMNETFDETMDDSATQAAAPGNSEEISHPDSLASSQDQQSDQTQNNKDFSEVTISAAPVMTENINLPVCQLDLPSFEQGLLKDNAISSPGVGEESGISSMTVSPDFHEAGNEFDMTAENMPLLVMDCDLQTGDQTEAQNNFFTDDVAVSVIKENTGMVFGPYPSRHSQQPRREHTDMVKFESFAANEDMFGHEMEDSYQRLMDQFMVQSAANVTCLTDELKTQPDMKAVVEVVEIKEKKEAKSAEKKEATEAEKEKDEDYEKTEISIMEATMDNNEWITDSNYQVLPWMNLSVPSLVQDHTKTDQLPTEVGQQSSSLTDATCIDTDTPPSTDVEQTSTLPVVEENMENNKKVVAVQPMPQNVKVIFRIHYLTLSPYQKVAITGDQQELGNWKGFIPLERAKDGYWTTVISLPAESHVEWKFVVVDKGEVCRWEECGNRLLYTGYGDDLLVHKWWGFL